MLQEPVTLEFKQIQGEVMFLGSSDASWGNAEGFKSQAGFFIWATDKMIVDGHACHMSPILFNSHKQHRIANSTLSAEAMALSECLDNLDYVNACWIEMNHESFSVESWVRSLGDPNDKWKDQRSGVLTVDAKSLFDALGTFGTNRPSCKRTCVEIAMICDLLSKSGHIVKWVPTTEMLADCLTKCGEQCDRMLEVLRGGLYRLVSDESVGFIYFLSEILGTQF